MIPRQAFNALRSKFKSTYDFVVSLFNEKHLQHRLRMMVDGCAELHEEYKAHLESQKEGPYGMLRWSADRATGRWYQTIVAMIGKLVGPDTIERLRLTTPSDSHVFDPDDPGLQDECKLVQQQAALVLTLACNRAWSQCHFGLVFPYCLVRIMSQKPGEKTRAQVLLRTLANAILALEDRVQSAHKKSPLHALYSDLGTVEWQITREILIQGVKADWSADDEELRKVAFACNCGPTTTKHCLENVISTVKDALQRQSKNSKNMSLYNRWLYAATSDKAPEGGVAQIQVDREDLLRTQLRKDTMKVKDGRVGQNSDWIHRAKRDFKQTFPTPEEILKETRKAGHLANKKAAAAAALVLQDVRRDFANVGKAWSGRTWPAKSLHYCVLY
eukprot:Skav212950  [mRNA]  locus=C9159477:1070:2230:- [translate_table: standard]